MDAKTLRRAEREALTAMQTAFPHAFPVDDRQLQPLAINIHEALLNWADSEPGVSVKKVHQALRRHCLRIAYKKVLRTPGTPRIDLQGRPVGSVTEEAAERAKQSVIDALEAQRIRNEKQQAARDAHLAKQVEAKRRAEAKAAKKKAKGKGNAKVQTARKGQPAASLTAPQTRSRPKPAAAVAVKVKKRRVVPPR